MPLSFYYCKGDGFHAVIEEHSKDKAVEHFIYIMDQMLEPEKGISKKDVSCEQVNVFPHEAAEQLRALDTLCCEEEGCKEPAVMSYCETHAP